MKQFSLGEQFSDVVSKRWCGIKCVEMNLLKTIPTHCCAFETISLGIELPPGTKRQTLTTGSRTTITSKKNIQKHLITLRVCWICGKKNSERPGICFPINRPERFKPSSSEKSGKSDNNCPRKSHSPKPATFRGSWLLTVGMVAWWVGYTKTVMEKEPFPKGKTSRVKNLFILACWFTSL